MKGLRKHQIKWVLVFLTSLLMLTHTFDAHADTKEYQVKAGFVLNFLKLIQFADDAPTRTICIANDQAIYNIFKVLDGESTSKQTITVILYTKQNQKLCNVIFVAKNFQGSSKQLIQKHRNRGVLTIGETANFTEEGGAVRFFEKGSSIGFEINRSAMKREKLKASSQLLRLATLVEYD